MKPVYQFPIPPLRPMTTNASSSTFQSCEPLPKKLKTDQMSASGDQEIQEEPASTTV